MKKFVRSKLKGTPSSDVPASEISDPKGAIINVPGDIVLPKPNDSIELLRKQLDTLSNENTKLKTSVQRLSDDNLYLHEQLEILTRQTQNQKGNLGNNRPSLQTVDSIDVRQSIKAVLDENEDLTKKLLLEREQNAILSTNFDREVKRLTRMYEESRLENASLERKLENSLLDIDHLHIQIGVWQKECDEKLSPEEFMAKFETSKLMLEELKAKYQKDLETLKNSLDKCQSDKRQVALKLVEIQADYAEAVAKNEQLDVKLTKYFDDNRSLNEILLESNKKLHHTESTLNDLLELCREILTKRQREEQFEDQKREALEHRLKKFEVKCGHLMEENRQLKHFKLNAASKLKQARQYLLHDDEK